MGNTGPNKTRSCAALEQVFVLDRVLIAATAIGSEHRAMRLPCGPLPRGMTNSNALGGTTFPVATRAEKNKPDLTRHAEDILLAREAYLPETIADLYIRMTREVPT